MAFAAVGLVLAVSVAGQMVAPMKIDRVATVRRSHTRSSGPVPLPLNATGSAGPGGAPPLDVAPTCEWR